MKNPFMRKSSRKPITFEQNLLVKWYEDGRTYGAAIGLNGVDGFATREEVIFALEDLLNHVRTA